MNRLVGRECYLSVNGLIVSAIIGLVLGSTVPDLPSRGGLASLAMSSLILLLLYIRLRRPLVLYVAACLWGLCSAIFQGQQLYEKRLPDSLAGSDWWVEAVVTGLPERTEQGERFDMRVERVLQGQVSPHPVKVQLNYYRERNTAIPEKAFIFQPGQRWQLWLRLKPPRGFVNENSFDYEGWLLQQGYHATGYVRDWARAKRLPDQACGLGPAGLRSCVDR